MAHSNAEQWPPLAPDINFLQMASSCSRALEDRPTGQGRNQLYRLRDSSNHQIFKLRASQREYEFQTAAAECGVAVPTYGRALYRDLINESIACQGFFMELGSPFPKDDSFSSVQLKTAMQQMTKAVNTLHEKRIIHGDVKLDNIILNTDGEVRLCDFAEGRWEDEDDDVWEGETTMHYMSPNRWREEAREGGNPPPVKEDDLYGLGLSIWEMYTGKIPFEDIADDDMQLRMRLSQGETVDVMSVVDEEVRATIIELLLKGGAHI